MSSVNLEKIYKAYEDIDAAGNEEDSLAKVKGSYEALIAAAHGESNCKRLAAQFIPRFFGKFPGFHETAIDALFDLCEDQDLNVRLTVIKHLPNVVKESKKYSLRITDALVQLLQNGSSQELLVVKKAIEQVIRIDPQASLRFIIQQAIVGSTEVKKHTINFLSVDLNKFKNELFDQYKDLEQFLADEIQKVLHEAEFFELEIFISMLSSLKVYGNNKSKLQDLSNSLINAIVTDKETFDPIDEKIFQKFVLCGKTILKFFENGVSGTEFLTLLIKILPYKIYSKLNEKQQITVLHYLAECASTSLNEETMKAAAPLIKDLFINEIPAPPEEAIAEDPKLNLPKVESIVYSLYAFASKIPDVSEGEQISSRFRYLYSFAITCLQRIRNTMNDLQKQQQKDQESLEKVKKAENERVVTNNILEMVKELMKPAKNRFYKKIALSWKKPIQTSTASSSSPTITKSSKETKRSIESNVTTLPTRNKIQKTSKDPPNIRSQNFKTSHIILKKAENERVVTNNILEMVKELMKPAKNRFYKKIALSWKKPIQTSTASSSSPTITKSSKETKRSIESNVTTLPTRNKIQKTSKDPPNIRSQNFKTSHIIRQSNKMSPKHGGSSGNMRNNGGARSFKIDRNSNKERNIYVPPPRRGT
ncbi:4392_t:CDS:10 [Entrophospora sp. SA101]|nr:4392_t:CDS:10 [Entrophospora sp. SA101]